MKLTIFLLMFLILIVPAFAAPPFTGTQSSNTIQNDLTIVYPLNFYYPQNENLSLNFDVLDSNATKLTNTTTNCSFILTNNIGELEILTNLTYNETNKLWNTKYYTDDLGVHSFYVHCVSGNGQKGYTTESFETTKNGSENIRDGFALFTLVSIPLFITIFLLLMAWFLPGEKYPALKIGLAMGSFVFIYQTYQYATIVLGSSDTNALLESIADSTLLYTWIYVITFTVIILTLIYDMFMIFSNKKHKTGEGYDENQR